MTGNIIQLFNRRMNMKMTDLEKRIEDAISISPKNIGIDVLLSDCLKEITSLKQKLQKIESGELVLVNIEELNIWYLNQDSGILSDDDDD